MKKNLLNPTPQQIKIRNRMWADALLKNKKKAIGNMYENGGRCCLAVAQNVAIQCGVENINKKHTKLTPDDKVHQFFGWGKEIPKLSIPTGQTQYASNLNDDDSHSSNGSSGLSHKKIAECVMNTFVHPSKKKWTFKL